MTEQLTLTCASKAELLADLDDHFTSLGLTLPTFTFSLPSHPSGIAEAVMGDGTRVLISVQENAPPRPLDADFAIEGPNAARWRDAFHVPLAAPNVATIPATRGDLDVPATGRGTGTVRPRTPSHVFSGIEPLPPIEGEDFEPVEEWEQRMPGVANGYPLAAYAMKDGARWYQGLAVPPPDPVAKNGGSYYVPGTLNSGWVMAWADGEEPDWTPDTQYLKGRVVQRPTNGRRYRAKVDEYAQAGREPENPVMQAVWGDIGEIEGWEPPPQATAWAPGQSVVVNDERTYNGRLYRCLQAHTTQAGWQPPNVPALWQDVGPAP